MHASNGHIMAYRIIKKSTDFTGVHKTGIDTLQKIIVKEANCSEACIQVFFH